MADFFDHLLDKHIDFINQQPMFFVASACATGRINLSPKGNDSFRVLSSNLCGYLDFTGSGNETSAHIKHDGRLTFMFNSFGRNPLILRLYGQGRVIRPNHSDFVKIAQSFPADGDRRQIILMDIDSVQTSCGYGVPVMDLVSERDTLKKWASAKGADAVKQYQQDKNRQSIDGFDTGLNDNQS